MIGERTKRFRPDRYLRVQFARGLKRDCHEAARWLVNAAHAVDRNLLDEKFLDDGAFHAGWGLLGYWLWGGVLVHAYDSTRHRAH